MFRHFLSFFLLICLSLSASLGIVKLGKVRVMASVPPFEIAQTQAQPEEQAKEWYRQGQLKQAIELWQKIAQDYEKQGDKLDQGRILSNLALAYSQVGAWELAQTAMTESLDLLQKQTLTTPNQTRLPILAEALNVQGTLFLAKGDALGALSTWEQATATYAQIGDELGLFRTQINQSRALQGLGLYRPACEKLVKVLIKNGLNCQNLDTESLKPLFTDSFSLLQREGWLSLAEVLRQLDGVDTSRWILEQLLDKLPQEDKGASIWLNLGQTLQIQGELEEAQKSYQRAIALSSWGEIQLKAQLAQLHLLEIKGEWGSIADIIEAIKQNISVLPINTTKIDAQLNLAQRLIEQANPNISSQIRPSWQLIENKLTQAQQEAQNIGYARGETYALGNLGELYEKLALAKLCQEKQISMVNCRQAYQFQDIEKLTLNPSKLWRKAQQLTEQALMQSQAFQAPEMTYLWQWQLGRIWGASGRKEEAIKAYLAAVNTLKNVTADLGANREFQLSFQDKIEPVYRELLALLLPKNNNESVSQDNLKEARQQIEALQVAELNNFFRSICVESQPVDVDKIDPLAAILYPIILSDRLVVLLSIPNQPLQFYVTSIEKKELEKVVEQLRYTVVIRSQREFYEYGQQVYQWLIKPFIQQLEKAQIKNLVFVPDGVFRNIPMATLYDGKQYLIEKYGVALTPGLTLLSPEALQKKGLNTLFAGLTEIAEKTGLTPLLFVNKELEAVRSQVPSTFLLGQEFTLNNLQQTLQDNSFPIVHFATHGQFSSQFEDTFISTWNGFINITELEKILKKNDFKGTKPIELLILSACETAAGDRQAALGLAGFAVRAGARSTIATLWSVSDEASAALMSPFYHQLATQNVSKAEALRQAQLTLLKNPSYRHPFYWSPYILVGNWL